jgi:hypothetical protein
MYNFDAYKSYDMNGRIDTIGLDHMLEGLAEKNKQVIILFYLKGNFRPIEYSVGHRKDTKKKRHFKIAGFLRTGKFR